MSTLNDVAREYYLKALSGDLPASSVTIDPLTLPISTISADSVTLTGPAGLSVINTDLLTGGVSGWFDASAFQSASIQIIGSAGISAGAVIFEQTNDLIAAPAGVPLRAVEVSTTSATPLVSATAISAGSQRVFKVQIDSRYIRARISTAFAGGTVQAVTLLSQSSTAYSVVGVSGLSNAGLAVQGAIAEDSQLGGGGVGLAPVLAGGVVRTTAPTTLIASDAARLTMTTSAAAVVMPYSVPEVMWQFTGTLTTTAATAAAAARAAGIRNYVTGFQFQNTNATATTVLVQDGATTVAQFNAPGNMALPATIRFATPLRGTAATALNVSCGTAGASVLVNLQGFQAI